jgi:hypothetical protein
MQSVKIRLVGSVFAVLILGQAACFAQGEYTKVTEDDVVALRLNHYFTADKKAHWPDFEWTFSDGEFVIKDGDGKIPDYLTKKLLPPGKTASEIRGKWKLEDKDGRHLVLSSIKADGKAQKQEASLIIYRTAPTVVRIGDVQHVFEVTD